MSQHLQSTMFMWYRISLLLVWWNYSSDEIYILHRKRKNPIGYHFFLLITRCPGKLARTSTKSGGPKVNGRANSPVFPRFWLFGLRGIRTCDLMEDNHLFVFSCLLGQTLGSHKWRFRKIKKGHMVWLNSAKFCPLQKFFSYISHFVYNTLELRPKEH